MISLPIVYIFILNICTNRIKIIGKEFRNALICIRGIHNLLQQRMKYRIAVAEATAIYIFKSFSNRFTLAFIYCFI